MPLLNSGRNFLMAALTGSNASPLFNEANTYIGVGDGANAFNYTQTDLTGVNKIRKAVDTGYPVVTLNQAIYQATYTGTEANFTWGEWGLFNAASSGVMLNRKLEFNGTKLAGQTWIFQTTVTVAIAP